MLIATLATLLLSSGLIVTGELLRDDGAARARPMPVAPAAAAACAEG